MRYLVNKEESDLEPDPAVRVERLPDRLAVHSEDGTSTALVVRRGGSVFVSHQGRVFEVERQGTNAGQTAFRQILGWAREENLTIRQLYQRFAGARGQRTVIGTASMIADDMQAWFDAHAVDGFLIQPATLPGGLKDFVEQVIPELRNRGLFRTEYDGPALRNNLGLPRPEGRVEGRVDRTAS